MAYARISVTVPQAVLAAADRRARDLSRSRSWIVAEALREYLVGDAARGPYGASVREPRPPSYGVAEVAAARRRHLAAELKLTPAERLRRAEELGRLARTHQRRAPRAQIIGFDSYEDYYEWKKARRGGA